MGARFGGLVLDTLLVWVVSGLISWPLGLFERHHSITCSSDGICRKTTSINFGWKVWLITLVVGVVYSALFVGSSTQTLGHRAAGVRVVDVKSGQPIGFLRAGLRWFVMALTGALLTLGYWSPFFDSRRRGWHDMASGAIAINAG